MAIKKEELIGLLEFISTAILIYINWVGYFNFQKMTIQLREIYLVYQSTILFSLHFLLITSISFITHLHLNPFITISFWLHNLIRKKRAKRLLKNQLFGTLCAMFLIWLQGFLKIEKVEQNSTVSIYIVDNLYDVWIDSDVIKDNTFLRKLFISGLTSFIYFITITIAFKRCKEERLKYGVIISFMVFALSISFRNESSGSINPLLYFPMMILSFRFKFDYFIFQILVPGFMSIFASYVALHAYKDFGTEKIDSKDIKNNLELIKPKKLKFEM